jgi:hypothetical protein
MIEDLIDISAFELEFRHRLENPFNEKWLNATRTRVRIQNLRKFLYSKILIIFKTKSGEAFYDNILKTYFKMSYQNVLQEIRQSNEEKTADTLYRLLFYKIPIQELFIIYTNLVNFEHQHFPYILQHLLTKEFTILDNKIIDSDDIFRYYIRVLDILSSTLIVSLFDLDALKNTVAMDKEHIGTSQLNQLRLYNDWPLHEVTPFDNRFPNFRTRLERNSFEIELEPTSII